jgi:hypothetical protein
MYEEASYEIERLASYETVQVFIIFIIIEQQNKMHMYQERIAEKNVWQG